MLRTNSKFKLITIFLFASLLFFSAGLVFSENSAKADTGNVYRKKQGNTFGDGCTYNGTLMNTVIFVEFVDQNGNNVGWSNGFKVNIRTTDPRNIKEENKKHSGIARYIGTPKQQWNRDTTFQPGGEGHYEKCDLRSIEKNGMATALNFVDATHNVNDWKLVCGYNQLGQQNLIFDITGNGQPDGIPSGWLADGWQRNDARMSDGEDLNFANTGVHLKYRLRPPPPPPPSGNQGIGSLINGISAPAVLRLNAGGTATFQHGFAKTAAAGRTWNVDVFATNGNWLTTEWPRNFPDPWTNLDVNVEGDVWKLTPARLVNFPTRQVYCEWADYQRLSGSNPKPTGSSLSNAGAFIDGRWAPQGVCAEVRGYNTVASSSLLDTPSVKFVSHGSTTATIKFQHTVGNRNIGPLGGGYTGLVGTNIIGFGATNANDESYNGIGPGADRFLTPRVYNVGPGSYCQQMYYWPLADNNGWFDSTPNTCVDVIDLGSYVPPVDYEKGKGAFTITDANFSINHCPAATVNIPYYVKVDGVLILDTSFTYGGGNCSVPKPTLPISSALANTLDRKPPGNSGIAYCIKIGNDPENCGTVNVLEVPYARFYGSDVYSQGLPFFNAPSVADLGGNPGALGWGSTSQFAVFAAAGGSGISGIDLRSAGFRTTGRPNRVEDLKARISPPPVTNVDSLCQKPTTITANLPSASDGACYISTDSYGLSGNYGNKRLTYITSGDVTIDGNITNSIVADSSVKSSADIPILVIKANNIKINSNVTRIDAILVANGNINTCDNVARASWNNNCNTNLTVNGAMYANNINFQRSIGTRLMGRKDEDTKNAFSIWSGGFNQGFGKTNLDINAWRVLTTPSDPLYVPNGFAAESINFPTYLYFATPGNGNPNSDTDMSVKSYLNLPPRL